MPGVTKEPLVDVGSTPRSQSLHAIIGLNWQRFSISTSKNMTWHAVSLAMERTQASTFQFTVSEESRHEKLSYLEQTVRRWTYPQFALTNYLATVYPLLTTGHKQTPVTYNPNGHVVHDRGLRQ
ncbi:hypothetical protein AX15_006613 [Amanita polypyramis BW_CC]|nr:hypothetical protein AX15_006613 [Amanita polypyramis BW_CC]